MVESDFFQCHFRINRNAYPRPADPTLAVTSPTWQPLTLFCYASERSCGWNALYRSCNWTGSVQTNFGYVKLAGIMPGVTATDSWERPRHRPSGWASIIMRTREANGSRIENDANYNIQSRLGFRTFIRTQEKNSGPQVTTLNLCWNERDP